MASGSCISFVSVFEKFIVHLNNYFLVIFLSKETIKFKNNHIIIIF